MTLPVKVMLAIGAISIVATIFVYLLLVPAGTGFFILALIALVLSELMLFGGMSVVFMLKGRTDSVLMVAGSTTLICVCSVMLFVTGLMFVPASLAMLGIFLSVCLLIVVIYGVGLAAFFFMDKRLQQRENSETRIVRANLARANRLKSVAEGCPDQILRNRLLNLSEDVRYSSSAVCASGDDAMDESIDSLCSALEAGDATTAEKLANGLFQAERNRKEESELSGRGGM